jgi:signal transduction histidine kinase
MTAALRTRLTRYVLPPVLVGLAHGLTRLMWPVMEGNLSLLFLTAVMVCALRGGLLAGLFASVLAGFTTAFFYYPPEYAVLIDFDDLLRLVVFIAVAIFVSWLSGSRRRYEEALRQSHVVLEQRVEERTTALREANRQLEEEVAERRRAEGQIIAYQDRLRSAGAELSLTEERQRRRIAATLHDAVGHRLAVAVIKLRNLWSEEPEVRPKVAGHACDLVEQAIGHTRSLTLQLSPPILYELGLGPAVEWLAQQVQSETGLIVHVEDDGHPDPGDDQVRSLLFGAIRELLINVVKHAKAGSARVSLAVDHDRVRVEVADDGVGLDAARLRDVRESAGFGLFNIRERLEHLGGRFEVSSEPGRGFRVTLEAPRQLPPRTE